MSAIGPQFYEFAKNLEENNGKLPASVTSRTFQPEFHLNNLTCYLCNGYYGPNFGEPVCATCHEFLYPDIPHHLPNSYLFSEKKDDGDSGNDEPSVGEFMFNDVRFTRALQQRGLPTWAFRFQSSLNSEVSPDDPVDLSNRPRCLINPLVLQRGPSSSGNGVGSSNNCGPNGGPSAGFSGAPQGGPNGGPDDGPNIGGPNGGPNIAGPNGGPNDDPNIGGPSGGPNETGPSHDDGLGPAVPDDGQHRPLPSSLAKSLAALSTPRPPDNLAPGLVEQLPSEVLLCIFGYLDDLALHACALVSARWLQLVRAHVPQARWEACARRRWPLFRPIVNIQDWHEKYQSLVKSCFCHKCVVQMFKQSQPPFEENAWRRNRLRNEIKMLRNSPPEGCAATPLDPKCCHWQAMVTGPVGSPYEGGVFYLYIQVPFSYPMSPPVVRFLTRILHPNVSRHGDVGIDSVHHNWSLALTISKLLISIQSLLTDPYTTVCMEPEVGEMYVNDRVRFERIARRWTWHYAMHDMHCNAPQPST